MAKTDAKSIVLASDGTTPDKLLELSGSVIENVQKTALSNQFKNTNYSGDIAAGSVLIKRFNTSVVKAEGTARTAQAGDKVKAEPVTVNLDQDKEIVEELHNKDIKKYGIPDLLGRRQNDHRLAMVRTLDRAFFAEAESAGSEVVVDGDDIAEQLESLIVDLEETSNDYVDGVERDLMVLTVKPKVFGKLKNFIDKLPNPNGGGVDANIFHNVQILSNFRQTKDAILMVKGSIGQPVSVTPYDSEKIPAGNGYWVELFFDYGTKAVMPDLIRWASLSEVSA